MINLLQQFYSRGSSPPPPVSPPPSTGSAFRQFNPCDPCCGAATSDPSTFCDVTPPDDLVLINGDGKHILSYQGLDGDGNSYWRGVVTFNNALAFTYSKNIVTGTRYSYDSSSGNPSACSLYSPVNYGFLTGINKLEAFSDSIDYNTAQTCNVIQCLSPTIPPSYCVTTATNYSMCLKHTVNFVPIVIPPVYVQITRKSVLVYGVPSYIFEEKIKTQHDSDYEYIKVPSNTSGFSGTTPSIKTYTLATELCNPIYMDGLKMYQIDNRLYYDKRTYFNTSGMVGFSTGTYVSSQYYTIGSTYFTPICVQHGVTLNYSPLQRFPFNTELSDNCWWSRSFPVLTSTPVTGMFDCHTFLGWSDDTLGKDVFTYDPGFFFDYGGTGGTPFSYTVAHPQFHIDNTVDESLSLFAYINRQKYAQQSNIWANGFFRVIIPNNNKRTINPVRFMSTRTKQLSRNLNCQIDGFNFELNCVKITGESYSGYVALYIGQPDKNHFGLLAIDSYNGDYNFYFIELINGASEYQKANAVFSRLLNKEIYTSFFGGGSGCNNIIGSCFNYSDYESTTCDPLKSHDFKEIITYWDRNIYKKSGNLGVSDVLNIDPLVIGFTAEHLYKTIYGDEPHTSDIASLKDCGGGPFITVNAFYDHYGTTVTEVLHTKSVIITELS